MVQRNAHRTLVRLFNTMLQPLMTCFGAKAKGCSGIYGGDLAFFYKGVHVRI